MIVPDDFLKSFAAPSFDELNQRVIGERKKMQDQLWTAGKRPILASIVLSLIGLGFILFTDPRSDGVKFFIPVLLGAIFVCLHFKRSREAPVIKEMEQLERRVEKWVAVMPIRLGTLPHTTFMAVLTPSGGFDLFPTGTAVTEAALRVKFGDACVVAPPFRLEVPSACQVPLDEFEMALDALACGVGEEFILPAGVAIGEIRRLAQYEAAMISSN